MIILGLESSCDETAAAVVEDNNVLSNIVSSQLLHQEYGGVVPEFASREHMKNINFVMQEALQNSGIGFSELDGIAATRGPGLMGSLLVGLSFAKGLAISGKKPLLGVNHIEGHIMANFLDHGDIEYPFLCLLVSGGHTMIIEVFSHGEYKVIGQSVDDAAGEAFDKGGKILHLTYPAGPIIDKIARKGDKKFHHFPRAEVKNREYDFSFSGLKTSLYYLVKNKGRKWAEKNMNDICAAYQEAIVDALKIKFFKTAHESKVNRLVLAGGVAANSRLREVFQREADKAGYQIFFPSLEYCTDNAAMIARAGLEELKKDNYADMSLQAVPNLKL
ncbi:MAG: tRNA (adenosine(37)-N6)-threonylcarbamoyltransferase complex transferase subunit TsaD [Candidatus Marinimicrobia bacterium]|nr:tRNA (adenosine(37)-N6)-threonylcarbamoyltransferase complex transferase subunit TsaD [Candidatus Neomarinimicrobiota bacterium]